MKANRQEYKGLRITRYRSRDYNDRSFWKDKPVGPLISMYVNCKICSEDVVRGEMCYGNYRVCAHVSCVEGLK